MNAFLVELENRPGELARVTEKLAAREVNVLLAGTTAGGKGAIGLIANDEERARSALRESEIRFREIPVVFVGLQDKPGQAARVTKKLSDAGINIELFLPVDTTPSKFVAALGVTNAEAARKILGDQVTTFTYR
jgi:hypothetical protein